MKIFTLTSVLTLASSLLTAAPATDYDGDAASIRLQSNSDSVSHDAKLDELVVKSSRIRRNANGFTMSMRNSELVKGRTMAQVLSLLPNIIMDNDGGLSIYGHTPSAVYINGIPMKSNDELKNIPPDRIDRIEVDYFNNGSEAASSRGGIMRVYLKRDERGLYNNLAANFRVSPVYGGYYGEDISNNTWASTGRFSFYNMAYYYRNDSKDKYKEDRLVKSTGVQTHSFEKLLYDNVNFADRFNVTCDLAYNQMAGVSAYIGSNDGENQNRTRSSVSGGLPDYTSYYRSPSNNLTLNGVAFYQWKIDDYGSSLDVTADYLNYKINSHGYADYDYADGSHTDFANSGHVTADMFRIRPSWKKAYKNGNSLNAGLDFQYLDYENRTTSNTQAAVNGSAACYDYAAYGGYSGNIGKFGYNANMRLQYDRMDVDFNGTKGKRTYWSVCPSVNLAYDIDSKHGHRVNLYYSRNVGGLPYDAVTSYRTYDGADHYSTGNPDLQREYSNYVSLDFTLFKYFSLQTSYEDTRHGIYYSNEIDPDDPTMTRSIPRNAPYYKDLYFQLTYNGKPFNWLTLKAYASCHLTSMKMHDMEYKMRPAWYFYMNSAFVITQTFGGGFTGYIDPVKTVNDQRWNSVQLASVYLYKQFPKAGLSFVLDATLYMKGRGITYNKPDFFSHRVRHSDNQFLVFTARYEFLLGKNVRSRKNADSIQQYNKMSSEYNK